MNAFSKPLYAAFLIKYMLYFDMVEGEQNFNRAYVRDGEVVRAMPQLPVLEVEV